MRGLIRIGAGSQRCSGLAALTVSAVLTDAAAHRDGRACVRPTRTHARRDSGANTLRSAVPVSGAALLLLPALFLLMVALVLLSVALLPLLVAFLLLAVASLLLVALLLRSTAALTALWKLMLVVLVVLMILMSV